MEAIAINQGLAMGQAGAAVQAGAGGTDGDFMQLIMQMMGQNPDDLSALTGGDTGGIDMDKLLGLSQEQDSDEETDDYLMELMASMLAYGTPQLAMYSGEEQTAAGLNAPSFADVVGSGVLSAFLPAGTQQGLPTTQTTTPDGKVIPFPTAVTESTDMPMEILSKGYNPTGMTAVEASEDIQKIFALGGRIRAIPGEQLPAEGKKSTEIIDIDALQQAVDSGRYMNGAADVSKLSAMANPQNLDILAQVKTGILANMDKGNNEFVIKLSPEGLGEITVKMTEAGGKVSLSIITGSQQAQNALASEISSLREALRPLGAEVTQLITQQEANLSQSFAEGRQGRQQQEQQQAAHLWDERFDGEEQQQVEYAAALHSALNAYI